MSSTRNNRRIALTGVGHAIFDMMVGYCLSTTLPSASGMTHSVITSIWVRVKHPSSNNNTHTELEATQAVASGDGGYQLSVKSRSKIECARECKKYSHCSSFVFDVTSGICYLQPTNPANSDPGLGETFITKDSRCDKDDAQVNGTVTWNHTLTSLSGEVTCYNDFVNTTNVVTVQCLANGTWQNKGQCLQHLWKELPSTPFSVFIPFHIDDGWSMCLEAMPTNTTRFRVLLMTAKEDIALRLGGRLFDTGSSLHASNRLNGTWYNETESYDVDFTVGQPFHLRVTVVMSTHMYEVYLNNTFILAHHQVSGLPPSDINSVMVKYELKVTKLNIWCSD